MGKRFVIVGTSGSGKTTLARQVAEKLNIKHVEVDALYHFENWTKNPNFIDDLAAALNSSESGGWVTEGNYTKSGMQQVAWPQADVIVWLDYPKWLCLWRITKRSIPRAILKTHLWNGNHETLRNLFSSKDSMIVWVWKTHGRRREQYTALMEEGAYPHLKWVRLKNPRATEEWLNLLASPSNQDNP